MKLRSWFLATLVVFAAPVSLADTITYGANLSGPAESPPNASTGFGASLLTVDLDNLTMQIQALFFGLGAETTIAHIHCCTAQPFTSTAGVATPLPSFPDFPVGVIFGSYDQSFDMTDAASWNPAFINANGGSTGSAFSALVAGLNEGRAYLNIHSEEFPGGEIRGFYVAAVPAPAGVWLLVTGLVALAGRRLRNRT